MNDDFAVAQREWARLPVDDVGYLEAQELLEMDDDEFLRLMTHAEQVRYTGWRNHENRWREHLIDGIEEKAILDFGCGVGIEALQFARAGNHVMLADINAASRTVAARLLRLHGLETMLADMLPIGGRWPFVDPGRTLDVFYANGVLHHTPAMPDILVRAHELLAVGGEVRLMLYTNVGWEIATGTTPPPGDPRGHPKYEQFLRYFDAVGRYAEPWWPAKLLVAAFHAGLKLDKWVPLGLDESYAAARLVSR